MAIEWTTGHCQKCHAKYPRRGTFVTNSQGLETWGGHVPDRIFICKKCWEKTRPKKPTKKIVEEKKPIRRKIEGWVKPVEEPMWKETCHLCGQEAILMWDEGRFRKLCPNCYDMHRNSYRWGKTKNGVRVWWRDDHIKPIDIDPKPVNPKKAPPVENKPMVLNFCGPRKIEW